MGRVGLQNPVDEKLLTLTGLFTAGLIICNVVSVKLWMLGPLVLSAGSLVYPLTFLCTDVVSEVWGKQAAKRLIKIGLWTNVMMVALFQLCIMLPAASFFDSDSFNSVLGAVPRIFVASIAAYLTSQAHDVWAFHALKRRTGGRKLWLRNNLSTAVSQFIDGAIFYVIAFGPIGLGGHHEMPWAVLVTAALTAYVIKVALAVLDTPVCYWLVAWARR